MTALSSRKHEGMKTRKKDKIPWCEDFPLIAVRVFNGQRESYDAR
jgi:hypothetical protein